MAELTVKCPQCGQQITAAIDLEVAKLAREHMKAAHGTDVPLEEAQKMVKEMLKGQSGRCKVIPPTECRMNSSADSGTASGSPRPSRILRAEDVPCIGRGMSLLLFQNRRHLSRVSVLLPA